MFMFECVDGSLVYLPTGMIGLRVFSEFDSKDKSKEVYEVFSLSNTLSFRVKEESAENYLNYLNDDSNEEENVEDSSEDNEEEA